MGNYWKHVLTHKESGKAIKTRYDEFKEGRDPTTPLPAATLHDAKFRERVTIRPKPLDPEVRSAPVDPVLHQQQIAAFAGALKAPPKTLKLPKYSRRPLTVPRGSKFGPAKLRAP